MRKVILLALVLLVLGGGTVPAHASTLELPEPTGRHRVGVTELHLVQHGRSDPWFPDETRELMVSVWYPAFPVGRRASYVPPALAKYYEIEPPVGIRTDWGAIRANAFVNAPSLPGKFPVVLYSPGVGNSRTMGTILAEELASRGYAVVTVDHTYEAAVEFPGGKVRTDKVFDLPIEDPAEIEKAKQRLMDAREHDVRFVLDKLSGLKMLDLSRVGMVGHSGGGVTAARVMQVDRRVDAGINMDGWFSFGYNRPELGVDRPFMFMGAGSSPQQPPLYGKPRTHLSEPDWRTFWDASTGWLLDLNFPAGRHYTFTDAQWLLPKLGGDHTGLIGTVDPAGAIDAQRAYIAAFFDEHLRKRPQPLLAGPSPRYPDVSFIR
ncbi:lipase [Kibdelosporangium persicum]|uniref:Platelet-activating factor acetylhydrolase isoform II n=1 Tax=Kibdelosporangium persicum TaxID=2698649 RepID=A0ABX2FD44_9PSEU|nr:lipase [Kibdelosporangium persicum]NRN69291.1 Platelet-activating factor acetylhydrolase isoform II [Kibdelosporangium persicum]